MLRDVYYFYRYKWNNLEFSFAFQVFIGNMKKNNYYVFLITNIVLEASSYESTSNFKEASYDCVDYKDYTLAPIRMQIIQCSNVA
jgi:hypothetical protein